MTVTAKDDTAASYGLIATGVFQLADQPAFIVGSTVNRCFNAGMV